LCRKIYDRKFSKNFVTPNFNASCLQPGVEADLAYIFGQLKNMKNQTAGVEYLQTEGQPDLRR